MKGLESCFESWVLSYLLNSLWQVPLLLAAGSLAARALKRTGVAAEHRLWVCVLLLQSLLPACSLLPWQRLRTLLAWGSTANRTGDTHVSVIMGPGTGFSPLRLSAEMLAAVAVSYCAVSAFFAARFLWRGFRLSALRREAVQVLLAGDAALSWAQCSRRFGIHDASIAASSQIFGPLTMGLRRKLVLLPVSLGVGLPAADLHTILAHECAHMRRNDFLKNLIYELLSLPVSYHPLFWPTRNHITETREMVCDVMAAEVAGRAEYALSLLRLASLLVQETSARTPHAIGIFDANAFERRLMKLTGKQNEIRGIRRAAIVVACAVFGVGACGSALALRMHVNAVAAASDSNGSKTDAPLTVPSGVMAGNKLQGPNPKYPEDAKKARIQGKVVLNAVIDKNGNIENLRVVSGPEKLRQPSLDAVRQWTYKPYLLNGNPVAVKTTVNVIYSLRK